MDISLALGGGGARGNAHIGVIRRLEQEGFRIKAVAGTSFGGIVAALYAAGYSADEIEELFARVDQSRLYDYTHVEGPALLSLNRIEALLREYLGERTFADTRIPCALTATDLDHDSGVILDRGSLLDAVLATIALPGIFPPRQVSDRRLVDGGMVDPVPVAAARRLAPYLPVVAVPLSLPVGSRIKAASLPLPIRFPGAISRRLVKLRLIQALRILLEAIDISGRKMTELHLMVDDPEVILRPRTGTIGLLDRVDVHAVARLGEKAVSEKIPELRRVSTWHRRVQRRLFRRQAG